MASIRCSHNLPGPLYYGCAGVDCGVSPAMGYMKASPGLQGLIGLLWQGPGSYQAVCESLEVRVLVLAWEFEAFSGNGLTSALGA